MADLALLFGARHGAPSFRWLVLHKPEVREAAWESLRGCWSSSLPGGSSGLAAWGSCSFDCDLCWDVRMLDCWCGLTALEKTVIALHRKANWADAPPASNSPALPHKKPQDETRAAHIPGKYQEILPYSAQFFRRTFKSERFFLTFCRKWDAPLRQNIWLKAPPTPPLPYMLPNFPFVHS